MTYPVIELNDSCITVSGKDGSLAATPGFALVQGDSIQTGDAARRAARVHPLQTVTRYWQRLGLDPLPKPLGHVRHHADLAFAQLQELYELSGRTEEVLFAVPGSFNKDQLGVLLGIVEPSQFRAVGMVDAAVAAGCTADATGTRLHLDLQLHQAVLTELEFNGDVSRKQVEVIADAGLIRLQDLWARLIADSFVRQCRFDPLHDANTEQYLYDRLPAWMGAFAEDGEQLLQIEATGRVYEAKLTRSAILNAAEPVYRQWRQRLGRGDGGKVLLSHRVADLPGFRDSLPSASVLAADAVTTACARHQEKLVSEGDSLRFIHRLPHDGISDTAETASSKEEQYEMQAPAAMPAVGEASHLLSGCEAHPLGASGLYLLPDADSESGLAVLRRKPDRPAALVCINDGQLWLELPAAVSLRVNDSPCVGSQPVRCGDRLSATDGGSLQLIRVVGDGA